MRDYLNLAGAILIAVGAVLTGGGAATGVLGDWAPLAGLIMGAVGGVLIRREDVAKAATQASKSAKLWVIGLGLCAVVMLDGCKTVTATIETAEDWRAAGMSARQAVPAYEAHAALEAVNVDGWTDYKVRDAALRDGAAAFAYGVIAARASGTTDYLACARYGLQVAIYWAAGRYPGLNRSWLDMLLERREAISYGVGRLGNDDLDREIAALLDWLDQQAAEKSVMLPLLLRPAV